MAAQIEASVIAGKNLGKLFRSAPVQQAMRRVINETMLEYAATERAAQKAAPLHRRTGGLSKVIIEPIVTTSHLMQGKVGSAMPYAEPHEKGATIHAKNVAHLAIPLSAMLTQRRVSRGPARDVIARPGSYGFDSTFARKGIIFGRSDKGITPLFALKEAVTLPARPTWGPSLTVVQPGFESRMKHAIEGCFSKGEA